MSKQSPFELKSTKTTRSPTRTSERLRTKTEQNTHTPTNKIKETRETQPKNKATINQEINTISKATEQPGPSRETATNNENNKTIQTIAIRTTKQASEPNTGTWNDYEKNKLTKNNTQLPEQTIPFITNPKQLNTKQVDKMNQTQLQQSIASFVPEFSGEYSSHRENNLTRFIDTATSIHETLTTDEERKIFIRLIKLRLTGDAYMRLSHRQITSFKELCDILYNMYTETYSLDELERRLTTTRQTYGETIRNYGYRLLEALERYKTAYSIKYKLDKVDITYENHLNTVTIQAFKRGLNNNILREKIATTRAKDINEIVTETETIDKMLADSSWTATQTVPTATETTTTNQPQKTNDKPTVLCNYCQRPNHTWDICRTRLGHEQLKKSINSQQYNSQLPRNQFNINKQPNIQYSMYRQGPSYRTSPQPQSYYLPRNQSQLPNHIPQRPQIQFERVATQPQYQQNQYRNNYTPKYCSHCKTTTGHTFDECRSKFFQKPNTQPNQNIRPAPPDANALSDTLNKMRINTMAPPSQGVHFSTQTNSGNGQGSSQQ